MYYFIVSFIIVSPFSGNRSASGRTYTSDNLFMKYEEIIDNLKRDVDELYNYEIIGISKLTEEEYRIYKPIHQ